MDIKYTIKLEKLLTFFLGLFVFVLIIDPTNTIIGIKDVVFFLVVFFCFFCYRQVNLYGIIITISVFSIILITSVNIIVYDYKYNFEYSISVCKSLSPLILLFWINKLRLIDKLLFPSLLVSVIVLITYFFYKSYPSLFVDLYDYYMSHGATIMIGKRSFIGIELTSFFYKTLPVLILPISIYMFRFFYYEEKKIVNITIVFSLLIAVILSGTRTSMLAVSMIFGICFFSFMLKSRIGKMIFIPFVLATLTGFFILFSQLVSDKEEASIHVKSQNIESYVDLIKEHPSIVFFGQGAGSYFYIKGREDEVLVTEWSYLEIFRMFGMFGALAIYAVFIYPLYIFYIKRKILPEWKPMFLGYFLYLIVGGTNPLLLGSTGMLVLLVAYSYAFNPDYEIRI